MVDPIIPDPDSSGIGWIDVLVELQSLDPNIVVPGHGAVGHAGLIEDLRT